MSDQKPREFFGYSEGQVYEDGSEVYCLTEGKPDQEFIDNPDHFMKPIHVIEKSAYDKVLKERDFWKDEADIQVGMRKRYGEAADNLVTEQDQEIDQLRADLDLAIEALNKYAKKSISIVERNGLMYMDFLYDGKVVAGGTILESQIDDTQIAKETLAKLEGK